MKSVGTLISLGIAVHVNVRTFSGRSPLGHAATILAIRIKLCLCLPDRNLSGEILDGSAGG